MHPPHIRRQARQMYADGVPFTEIYRRLGLPRSTVACWLYGQRARASDRRHERCPFCDRPSRPLDDPAAYANMFGQYLGDGHLLMSGRVPLLTVACDLRYPGIIHETATAIEACGASSAGYQEQIGCIRVRSHWKH